MYSQLCITLCLILSVSVNISSGKTIYCVQQTCKLQLYNNNSAAFWENAPRPVTKENQIHPSSIENFYRDAWTPPSLKEPPSDNCSMNLNANEDVDILIQQYFYIPNQHPGPYLHLGSFRMPAYPDFYYRTHFNTPFEHSNINPNNILWKTKLFFQKSHPLFYYPFAQFHTIEKAMHQIPTFSSDSDATGKRIRIKAKYFSQRKPLIPYITLKPRTNNRSFKYPEDITRPTSDAKQLFNYDSNYDGFGYDVTNSSIRLGFNFTTFSSSFIIVTFIEIECNHYNEIVEDTNRNKKSISCNSFMRTIDFKEIAKKEYVPSKTTLVSAGNFLTKSLWVAGIAITSLIIGFTLDN